MSDSKESYPFGLRMSRQQNDVFLVRFVHYVQTAATQSAVIQCLSLRLKPPHSSSKPVDVVELARKRVLAQHGGDPARMSRCHWDRIRIAQVQRACIISIARHAVHSATLQKKPIYVFRRLICHYTPRKVLYTSVLALSTLLSSLYRTVLFSIKSASAPTAFQISARLH